MKTEKTVNVHPCHCEFKGNVGGFTLTFYDRAGDRREVHYVIHFEFWWIKYLARSLWEAVSYRQNEVAEAERAMKREP